MSRPSIVKFMKILKDGNYINYSTKNNNTKIYVTKYSNYQFIFDEDIS